MPPQPQKGTGKKGRDRDVRQSRSRNTTPSLTGSSLPPSGSGVSLASGTTAFLNLPVSSFRTLEDSIENYGGSTIPSYRDLEALLNQLNVLAEVVDQREEVCDKGMRLMAKERKERVAELEEIEGERREKEGREEVEREREREKDREREREKERGRKKGEKGEKKKRRDGEGSVARDRDRERERDREVKEEKERPLTHGAHGLAAQDGTGFDISTPSKDKKPTRRMSRDNDSASSSLSPAPAVTTPAAAGNDDKDDDESSMDEHQPPPAPAVPHMQTFGDDPSTFPDPTRYDIPTVTEGMTDDEKREIYSVAVFPKHSLDDMIPGPTPDMDYSNAKPTNQVQFNTFSTYIDPYFRQFTEEDLAFLRERGDRVGPYVIPRRGKRHYTEVWAEEDGAMSLDGPQQGRDKLPLNQPRGSIDQMDDNVAESDQISAGPVLSRLLATLRPEHRAPAEEKPILNGFANTESSVNGDINGDLEVSLPASDGPASLPSATQMPGSNEDSWRKATHPKLDYAQVDERIKQELRHIGFIPPDTEPDYDAHYDDETAQRLRILQEMLKARAIKNGAMKARLMDLTREQMAHQEFNTILEDLDDQVKGAYLKRNRTLGKSKKAKKPGGAGGGSHFVAGEKGVGAAGMARPGLGDATRSIMEKRRKWIETIGTVLDPDASKVRRAKDEGSGIFGEATMRDYERKELEAWDDAMDDE